MKKTTGHSRKYNTFSPALTAVINEIERSVTDSGIAYCEGLARARARIDAGNGEHDSDDRGVSKAYMPYYREAYENEWNSRVKQ